MEKKENKNRKKNSSPRPTRVRDLDGRRVPLASHKIARTPNLRAVHKKVDVIMSIILTPEFINYLNDHYG